MRVCLVGQLITLQDYKGYSYQKTKDSILVVFFWAGGTLQCYREWKQCVENFQSFHFNTTYLIRLRGKENTLGSIDVFLYLWTFLFALY